jgi:hypothetical protein
MPTLKVNSWLGWQNFTVNRGTRFLSLLGSWRGTRHCRGGTTLFSSVAWGPHEAHQTSRTYGGAAHLTSSLDTIIRSTSIRCVIFRWVYHHDGGREEARSPWVACSERRPWWPSSLSVRFSYRYLLHDGTPRLGAILQWNVSKHPQGIHLGNSWPWRLSLMKECRISHSVWRELNKWFPMY